jgi:hypothetical protein
MAAAGILSGRHRGEPVSLQLNSTPSGALVSARYADVLPWTGL